MVWVLLLLGIALWVGMKYLEQRLNQSSLERTLKKASKHGQVRDAFHVAYLGGHPERPSSMGGAVGMVITADALVFPENLIRDDSRVYFRVPFSTILDVKALSSSDRITVWSSQVPIPLSWNTNEYNSVAIAFRDAVGDISVLGIGPHALDDKRRSAQVIANQICNAIYEWKKTARIS